MGEVAAEFPQNMHPQAYYTTLARRYNLEGIWYLDLWPIGPSFVILSDPELLEAVTTVKPLGQHQASADFIDPLMGKGIIATVNGPAWKSLHRAMTPAFSWSHIKSLTTLITDECMLFRKTLNHLADTGETFSMEHTAMKLVFDVIARVVFNTPLNAQTQGSQYLDDLREMISLAEELFDPLVAMNPIARIRIFFRKRQVLSRLHPSIVDKIQERLDLLLKEGIMPSRRDPNSILDLMLREKMETERGSADMKRDVKLSSEEIEIYRNNVKGLLAGGHGTTTDTLCYAYMLLSKAPESMTKLRKECVEVFGTEDIEQIRNIVIEEPEKLQAMPYLEAVIKEALRLFPVGFGIRAANDRDTLTYKGRTFPIDHDLAIALQSHDVHYNPDYFPEPSKFMPERWLDPEHPIPRSYFRTFGRGLRACAGMPLFPFSYIVSIKSNKIP